jgi:HAD superfamily hydrolase (TIGR01549 family)
MLETLSLDAGGVLVRPNWPRIASVFQAHGIRTTPEALRAVELKVMREQDREAKIRETNDNDRVSDFFSQSLDHAGANGSPAARLAAFDELKRIHKENNLWNLVYDDVIPALERFKAIGLRLIVLSNANGTIKKMFENRGILHWFSHVVDSGEEIAEKPDPRFFEIALGRAGANRETTLHVGDMYFIDVLGARAAGIRAALIDRGGLRQDRDCPRFADLIELAVALEQGQID